MQNTDNRISSFAAVSKPKSKAKPAFPLSESTHPHLTPKALASAGFYHTPGSSSSSLDNCTCFLCNLELGGWDKDDDPFEEHAKRSGCAWAEIVCAVKLEKRKRDRSEGQYITVYPTPESLPQSAASAKIREQTFKKWWPHKQKSGWLPTVKELARAGFVFNPSTTSKDAVICPYCEYAVEGWEATDDPWQIHSAKVPDCHFFRSSPTDVNGVQGEPSKASAQVPKSQTSKRSKRATTAATPAVSDGEEIEISPSQAVDNEQDDEAQSSQAATSNRRATKPRATTTNKAAAGGRGRKKATTAEPEMAEDSEPLEELVVEPEVIEDIAEEEEEDVKEKKARGKSKGSKNKPRSTTAKGKSKKQVDDDDEAELAQATDEAALQSEVEDEIVPAPAPSSKAKSTSSKASAKSAPAKPLPALPAASPTPTPALAPASSPDKRPLSQLDRFANIPPSSPIPSPRPKSTLRTTISRSTKPSPHALPREALDNSLTRGAIEARRVMESLMSSPIPQPDSSIRKLTNEKAGPGEKEKEKEADMQLTEEQKHMTLEQLVRSEMRKRYEEMQREGEDMIQKWEERARYERKRIDAL